jgi:hypothetical protein
VLSALTLLGLWLLAFTARDPFFLAPFRESQTAISADYLLREPGAFPDYQLPVLGAPWEVPFEFPLFQQLTAWLGVAGITIAQAGRSVSLLCWLGCAGIIWAGSRDLGIDRVWRITVLSLASVAPLHGVYSTAHMIESMALMGALLQVWAFYRFLRMDEPSWLWFILALGAGMMAALVKITTWMPAAFMTGLMAVGELWKCRSWRPGAAFPVGRGLLLAGMLFLPLLAGQWWSKRCADIRSENALSAALQDPATLNNWVFGTLAMRLSVKDWGILLFKHLILLFGPMGLLAPLLGILAWRQASGWKNPLCRAAVILMAGYGVHAILLFGLHLRHDYYLFGSGIYLVGALLLPLVAWTNIRQTRLLSLIAPVLALSMALGGLLYQAAKRGYRDLAAEAAMTALAQVKEPGALLILGGDWSPRIPFATGRKALMIPGESRRLETAMPAVLAANRNTRFAGMVVFGNSHDRLSRLFAEQVGMDPDARVPFWSNGYLLLPPGRAGTKTEAAVGHHPLLLEIQQKIDPRKSPPNGVVHKRLPFSGRGDGWLEIGVKRGRDLFFYRASDHSLIRLRGYFDEP